jgi:hypothetical protein
LPNTKLHLYDEKARPVRDSRHHERIREGFDPNRLPSK